MIKQSFKLFIRSLLRERKYATLNVIGLSVGLSSFLLISLYLKSELEYDQFHEDSDKIFRVLFHSKTPINELIWARSGPGILPEVKPTLPNVVSGTRILAGKNVLDPDPLVKNGDTQFLESKLFFADTEFFDVFTFQTVDGSSIDFSDPYAIVLTESSAKKYFGSDNAIGQILELPGHGRYTVRQVLKDLPANSHFHFDLIANIQSHDINDNDSWGWTRVYTYLRVKNKENISRTQELLQKALEEKYSSRTFNGASYEEWRGSGNEVLLLLQPLESIHLNSNYASEFEPGGDKLYIRLFFIVAGLVLALSCINFINLYTSQSFKYAKDVSVQKTFGASRRQLFYRFVLQSIILTFFATILAIGISTLAFPFLNSLVGERIAIPSIELFWFPVIVTFSLFIGLLAGIYPAIHLSKFKPIDALRARKDAGGRGLTIRNLLIVFQFCISIGLIVATLTIYNQIEYMKDKDLGFESQLIVIERANVLGNKTEAFKKALLEKPMVKAVASSSTVPGSWIGSVSLYPTSGTIADRTIVYPIFTDFDFDKTFDFEFVQGRGFSKEFASDSLAVIINETALKALGLESIEGQSLKGWRPTPHPIVGVVKDFNQGSPKEEIKPMVIFSNFFPSMQNMSIRLNNYQAKSNLEFLKTTWDQFASGEPLMYYFLDQDFDKLYANETETGNLFSLLSFLAIMIATLGLFGLTGFAIEQRGKEFAIRKVLGAGVSNILSIMGGEFGKLIAISLLISLPIAWVLMDQWLESFAYRSSIPYWIFLLAGGLTFLVTTVVTITQTLKTAIENPVKRLRDE